MKRTPALTLALMLCGCQSHVGATPRLEPPSEASVVSRSGEIEARWSTEGGSSWRVYASSSAAPAIAGRVFEVSSSPALLALPPGTWKIAIAAVGAGESAPTAELQGTVLPPGGLSLTTSWSVSGAGASFGNALSLGDSTGDGHDDLLVGDSSLGRAQLFVASNGSLSQQPLWTQTDGSEAFGETVLLADVTRDGFADAFVSAPQESKTMGKQGAVFLFPSDGSSLATVPVWERYGTTPNEVFGGHLALAGDVDGDGFADVVASSPGLTDPDPSEGGLRLLLGSADAQLGDAQLLEVNQPFAQLGQTSGAIAGDLNGDGFQDLVAGASGWSAGINEEGAAVAFFGNSSGGFETIPGWFYASGHLLENLGSEAIGAGDIDCDGYADIAVASPLRRKENVVTGAVLVFRGGPNGVSPDYSWELFSPEPSTGFSRHIASGDFDGDGCGDIVVSDQNAGNNGRVYVWLGSPLGLPAQASLMIDASPLDTTFATALAVGDVDGDGLSDLAAGTFTPAAGRALLFAGVTRSGPSVSAGAAQRAHVGESVTPMFAGFSDPRLRLPVVCDWEWGDGATDHIAPCDAAYVASVTHIFTVRGTLHPRLHVQVSDGRFGESITTVEVGE